jgi:peroxiredoxin
VCGLEFPDLEQLARDHDDDDLFVVGLYRPSESPDLLDAFREQTGVTFPLVADAPNTSGQLAFPAGVGFPYPRDVVIGPDLRIRAIRASFNADELDALVRTLLAE